jgi:hypothetical protein
MNSPPPQPQQISITQNLLILALILVIDAAGLVAFWQLTR